MNPPDVPAANPHPHPQRNGAPPFLSPERKIILKSVLSVLLLFSLEYMRYSMNPVQAYSRIFLSIFAILLHFHIPRQYPLVAYFCILLNIFISVCDYKKQVRDGTASLLRSQRRDSWLYYPIWIYDCLGLLAGPNRSVADRLMALMLASYFAAVVFWFGADAFWDVVHALQDGFDGYLTD